MESLDRAPAWGRYVDSPSELEFFQIIEQSVRQAKCLSCVPAARPVIHFTRPDPTDFVDGPGQGASRLTDNSCVHRALTIRELPIGEQGRRALHPEDKWPTASQFQR
jgi:hypothetical protein